MMRTTMIVAALLFSTSPYADVFRYACRSGGKSYDIRIDDARNVLTWQGRTYRIRTQESCAKFGWRAERQGESFDFCTATQGYADFQYGGKLVQCDQNR